MNFYKVTFESGKTIEIRSTKDYLAVGRAENLLKRWNQRQAIIFRVNPYNATRKKGIGVVENKDYDPDKPQLLSDPKELYEVKVPEKKKKARKKKEGSTAGSSHGPRSTFEVPLKDVADKLGVQPTALRRKLRGSDIQKPEGGWGWTSWEDQDVITILGWFQK